MTSSDEFEIYFARAAMFPPHPPQPVISSSNQWEGKKSRTDSLPDIQAQRARRESKRTASLAQSDIIRRDDKPPARTASCKYPQRYLRKGSVSPRDSTNAPTGGLAPGPLPPMGRRSLPVVRGDVDGERYPQQSPGPRCSLRAPSPPGGSRLKSRSVPHSRSSSWRKVKRPHSNRELGGGSGPASSSPSSRSRSGSVTLEETITAKLQELKLLQADNCCVVRQFSSSSRGRIVNRGDSIKRKTKNSSNRSPASTHLQDQFSACKIVTADSTSSCDLLGGVDCDERGKGEGSHGGAPIEDRVHVVVVGEEGVGKTALLQQFMTSEFMAAEQTNFDAECEKLVSVCLDETETIIEFTEATTSIHKHLNLQNNRATSSDEIKSKDGNYTKDSSRNDETRSNSNICGELIVLFIYSLTDRRSFQFVLGELDELRQNVTSLPVSAILVGNKSDLVRTRQIPESEGREMGRALGCVRFQEVSAALNHQVDELLVTIVTVHRANKRRQRLHLAINDDNISTRDVNCVRSAADILKGLFKKQNITSCTPSKSKSCETLLDS